LNGARASVQNARMTPQRKIACVSLLVRDYDEAIAWYRRCLRFAVAEDRDMGSGKRWVVVVPESGAGTGLLLAKAASAEQEGRVGSQAGGRVFLFLHTDDFKRDHAFMKAQGVVFAEEPRHEPYGTVAVFSDLYGNTWDLLQPAV
jgi:catechol 2,3-dioxygenase-like lactoylglutathione lyase family enzyme